MASYFDLLDAIARVRAVTGSPEAWHAGLSGEDIATACNPVSSPAALSAVLNKIIAAHPRAFADGPVATQSSAPGGAEGSTADAIREAETSLAQQNSAAAQVDLHVVTAVLNAHGVHADGSAELERLQNEIENAVLSRTDLDTPTGAREFQRYLIGKLRDIHQVVDGAGLEATSKAELAAALAALYAASAAEALPPGPGAEPASKPAEAKGAVGGQQTPEPAAGSEEGPGRTRTRLLPDLTPHVGADPGLDHAMLPFGFGDLGRTEPFDPPSVTPAPQPSAAPAPASPLPAFGPPGMAPFGSGWGGGVPGGAGFPAGPALPTLPAGPALPDLLPPDLASDPLAGVIGREQPREAPETTAEEGAVQEDSAVGPCDQQGEVIDATAVELPTGEIINAPTPELAAVITAAVAGAPIPDAFRQQGINIPAPGTPVTTPVVAGHLVPGDLGLLNDRHALALGNGTAVLDNRIQPISNVTGPGFLGWQHPPAPQPTTTTPAAPAPNRTAATAPS